MRCTPSPAGTTTMVPPRSRILTRVPGAQPSGRTAPRSATRPLLSTALTTYAVSTARAEPGSNAGTGSGARRRPDGPVPARPAGVDRGITGGTNEMVTATTSAPGRQSHGAGPRGAAGQPRM